MANDQYLDVGSARYPEEENASDTPQWISRKDMSGLDTLTAIRAASAVFVARYAYSDSIIFDPTVVWSGLLPIAKVAGGETYQPSSVDLDEGLQLGNLLDQLDRHASSVLSIGDADFQTVRPSATFQGNGISRVILVIHRRGMVNEEILCSIENGMLNGSSSLVVEYVPSMDKSLLRLRVVGQDISVDESRRSRSSFQQIFTSICNASRTVNLHDLFTISTDDMRSIWKWNSTPLQMVDAFVHHLIEQQARAQPESVAVHSWEGELTYAELDELSSQLAAHLANDKGVYPGKFVPLCFEKSMWAIVAMLAVLKAGGAFVPLDPSHPPSRMQNIISQVKADLVLTSTQHFAKCANIAQNVDEVSHTSLQDLNSQKDFYLTEGSIASAAYVIFTSGSTGNPKGVVIEHRQVSTSSIHGGRVMCFESKPRMLQFASYTFDACILEIVSTLVYGGCVCVPSEGQRMNDIVAFMNTAQVTCAFFTPSLLVNLAPEELETLETIILGGESIPNDLVENWNRRIRLIIAYGPTECCVICCTLDTSCLELVSKGDIGNLVGARPWIVDPTDSDTLAPIGTVGELLIEGPVLAREYINDEAKTASAFIQNPRWMRRGGRLYKTGDLVRYNANGSLNFVCRKDNQVKLRGQRLELEEVEQQIRRCLYPLQVEVAAELVTPTDGKAGPFLAAFVCPIAAGIDDSGDDARNCVDNFPQSIMPSGDADRSSLSDQTRLNLPYRQPLLRQASDAIFTARPKMLSRGPSRTFNQPRPAMPKCATYTSSIDAQRSVSGQQGHRLSGISMDETARASDWGARFLSNRPEILRSASSTSSSIRSSALLRTNSDISVWSTASIASSRTDSSVGHDWAKLPETSSDLFSRLFSGLKEALAEKIPRYMIPSTFIQLKEMPLTTSGKADRRGLRRMALDQSSNTSRETDKMHVPHQQMNEIEQQMQRLWATGLKLETHFINLDSNFFQLGGDSISAMRVVAAARRLGLSFTVDTIFKYPKLSELLTRTEKKDEHDTSTAKSIEPFSLLNSERIDQVLKEAANQCCVGEEMIEDIYPCTPLQAGMVALSEKAPSTYIMRFVYSLPQSLDIDRFKEAWERVAEKCPILRTTYIQTAEADLLQVVLKNKNRWTTFTNGCDQSSWHLQPQLQMGAGKPLAFYSMGRDLDTGGICFQWEVHHSLVDGWSLPLILEKVDQEYSNQHVEAGPAFNSFVKHTSELDLQACGPFWKNYLDGAPTPDFPKLPSATYQPETKSCFRNEVQLIGKQESGITTATLIRASWPLLISTYVDSDDVTFWNHPQWS